MPKGIYDRATSKQPKTRHSNKPAKVFGRRRRGITTPAEMALVSQFVKDQKDDITPKQIESLSELLKRRKNTVKHLIFRAREKFNDAAEEYVDIHLQATRKALKKGDNEQAIKGSAWAIQNISAEGERIIDKPTDEGSSGVKVLVGVKIGGATVTTIEPVE